jgi:hypothetical protein
MRKILMAGAMLGLLLGVAAPFKATALTVDPGSLVTPTDSTSLVTEVARRGGMAWRGRGGRGGVAWRGPRGGGVAWRRGWRGGGVAWRRGPGWRRGWARPGRAGLLLQSCLLQPLLQSALGLLPDRLVERRAGMPLGPPSLVVSLMARRGDCEPHSERSPPSI